MPDALGWSRREWARRRHRQTLRLFHGRSMAHAGDLAAASPHAPSDLLEWSDAHRHRRLRAGRLRPRSHPRGRGSLGGRHRSKSQSIPSIARRISRASSSRDRDSTATRSTTRRSRTPTPSPRSPPATTPTSSRSDCARDLRCRAGRGAHLRPAASAGVPAPRDSDRGDGHVDGRPGAQLVAARGAHPALARRHRDAAAHGPRAPRAPRRPEARRPSRSAARSASSR